MISNRKNSLSQNLHAIGNLWRGTAQNTIGIWGFRKTIYMSMIIRSRGWELENLPNTCQIWHKQPVSLHKMKTNHKLGPIEGLNFWSWLRVFPNVYRLWESTWVERMRIKSDFGHDWNCEQSCPGVECNGICTVLKVNIKTLLCCLENTWASDWSMSGSLTSQAWLQAQITPVFVAATRIAFNV